MDDLERIYDIARQLDPASRADYLERECGGDAELRAEVEALLAASDDAGSFLARGSRSRADTTAEGNADLSAAQIEIGPYRLLQRIGEGGFGDVYMAEQSEPVRRRVALKVIKLGMDTRQVVARFEQERQALALMDHPNIAKVFDAGATESGRPYFVMELVSGESLTRYCDQHSLSIHERLELFTQVCHAVQHAHQKGIIHRDIKPNNVLVTTRDGSPHAMVIDFGIAKATNARLTERTLFTQHRQLIGTPAYMSPEQASGSLDVDTRTDVYSLGVLLYELLTGATPFGSTELPAAAYAEIQRIICEVDPPAPSRQISENAASLASVAAQRRTDPAKLGPLVRGELDWIVMKALEKDRRRRYPTPGGLAGDIARFLGGEAVEAAPPSAAYKARKFVARHKAAVTAAALVGCALVLGVIGTAWQAGVARDERDSARAARTAESEQRRVAEGERDRAEAIAGFLSEILSGIDPSVAQGRDTTMVKALMDDAARQIASGELSSTPDVELALRRVIGRAYIQLALSPEAAEMLEPTVALSRRIHDDEAHPDVYTALSDLAWLARRRGDAAAAEDLYRRSLELRREAEPEPGLAVARGVSNLAYVLTLRGKRDEARELRREAAALLQSAIETRRQEAGGDHPELAEMLRRAANDMRAAGDLGAAEALYRDALETRRRLFPAGDALTVQILGNLGFLMQSREDWAGAREHYRAALELSRRLNPGDHPDVVQRLQNLAHAVGEGGDWQEASALLREGLRMQRRLHLEDHPATVGLLGSLSVARQRLDDADPALRLAEDALGMVRRLHRGDSMRSAARMFRVADLRLERGDEQTVGESASDALAMARRLLRDRHPRLLPFLDLDARVRLQGGDLEEALAHAREAHEIATSSVPATDERAVQVRLTLGRVLAAQERFAAAERELLGAEESVVAAEVARPDQRRRCIDALIALYEAWDAAAPGEGHGDAAARLREALEQD